MNGDTSEVMSIEKTKGFDPCERFSHYTEPQDSPL